MLQVNLYSIAVNFVVTLVTGIALAQQGLPNMKLEGTLRHRAELLKMPSSGGQKLPQIALSRNLDLRALGSEGALNKIQRKEVNPENLNQLLRSGGVDTGGGSFYRGGLLDLALFNKEAFLDNTPGLALPSSQVLGIVKVDKLKNLNSTILSQTMAQVKKWIPNSPEVAGGIAEALKRLPIYVVDGRIGLPVEGAALPVGFAEKAELRMMAYYLKGFGVFISKPDFEGLSFTNQKALLIHEALRRLQINTKFQGMSDLTLQKLTAKIMKDPVANESLDTSEFMAGAVLNLRAIKDQTLLKVVSEAEKACQRSQDLCYVAGLPYEEVFEGNHHATQELAKEFRRTADKIDTSIPRNLNQEQTVEYLADSQGLRSAANALLFWAGEFVLVDALEDLSDLHTTLKYRGFEQVLQKVQKDGFVNSEYRQLFFELHNKLGV